MCSSWLFDENCTYTCDRRCEERHLVGIREQRLVVLRSERARQTGRERLAQQTRVVIDIIVASIFAGRD